MYLNWDTQITQNFDPKHIQELYNSGYVFTRVDKGVMNKTRSLRIDLTQFEASSENRRIARKSEHLELQNKPLPLADYSWKIAKLAKDFYTTKFGEDTFSANKIKELLTETSSNFNTVLTYTNTLTKETVGYVISYEDENILHYSYPFYAQDPSEPSRGLGMMIQAILYAQAKGLKYIYLGSLQRPTDTYKLQFKGMEWFDGEKWQSDISPLKEILK